MVIVLILASAACITSAIAACTQIYMINQYHRAVRSMVNDREYQGRHTGQSCDDSSNAPDERDSL